MMTRDELVEAAEKKEKVIIEFAPPSMLRFFLVVEARDYYNSDRCYKSVDTVADIIRNRAESEIERLRKEMGE